MQNLTVRPAKISDADSIINYWKSYSPADLERMGVDATKFLAFDDWRKNLHELIQTPLAQAKVFYLIWEVESEAIGFNSLKNIVFGDSGEMHLHMWRKDFRGKGFGGTLFCLAALKFYELFSLKKIICEPKSTNPLPNRMLQKVGFKLVGRRVAASSELALVCELNTYQIDRPTAERYLQSRG